MPSHSRKQAIAMRLAAAGKSSIGIPPSVGREFVKADKGKQQFALPKKKAKRKS